MSLQKVRIASYSCMRSESTARNSRPTKVSAIGTLRRVFDNVRCEMRTIDKLIGFLSKFEIYQ